jgi:hypothetical protein
MGPFRVLQLSIVVLMLFGSTWLVRIAGMSNSLSGDTSTWLSDRAVLAGVLQADNSDNSGGNNNNSNSGDNGGDNGSGGDNGDSGDNGSSNNNNSNSNSDGNGNGNGNDSSGNDNFDFDLPPLNRPDTGGSPNQARDPGCAQPGSDVTYTSRDGKVVVRVFPNTPSPVRVEILPVIDFLSAPLPPGQLVGLLAYEIRASHCDQTPLVQLPAEMNVQIHYSDLEATGLDESKFVIGHLNMQEGTWYPVEKRANDAASNVVTATISETGFYMVWEQR